MRPRPTPCVIKRFPRHFTQRYDPTIINMNTVLCGCNSSSPFLTQPFIFICNLSPRHIGAVLVFQPRTGRCEISFRSPLRLRKPSCIWIQGGSNVRDINPAPGPQTPRSHSTLTRTTRHLLEHHEDVPFSSGLRSSASRAICFANSSRSLSGRRR